MGTTLVFGSWAVTADGLGGFSSHLVTPKASESKSNNQLAKFDNAAGFGGNQALPKLNSEITENVSTPTRVTESAESDANSNSENSQFSEMLGKYVAYLKSIKCPMIVNSELLDGVDRVSQSIARSINLAESALGSSKTQQNP